MLMVHLLRGVGGSAYLVVSPNALAAHIPINRPFDCLKIKPLGAQLLLCGRESRATPLLSLYPLFVAQPHSTDREAITAEHMQCQRR